MYFAVVSGFVYYNSVGGMCVWGSHNIGIFCDGRNIGIPCFPY
jgi:hypothetical protein